MPTEVDVAIIGAGAAGVGAARRLAGSGRSVVLLEASARVGGRAFTQRLAGMDLDLGCEWLHSADRNSWVAVAEQSGTPVHRGPTAWGVQFRGLGFSNSEQSEARNAFADWIKTMRERKADHDRASDTIDPASPWRAFFEARVGYISGVAPEDISVADYLAYEDAATGLNWRLPHGYGTLVAASFPRGIDLRLGAPLTALHLQGSGVDIETPQGNLRARCAILTMSNHALLSNAIELPRELAPWKDAASHLPLGRNEKLFFEILGDNPFAPETHVVGNPHDPRSGAYYIRPFGQPVIEGFFGGAGARMIAEAGPAAGFTFAFEELVALFGSDARRSLRPLVASNWSQQSFIGGAYSCALPEHAGARAELAHPFDDRIFFAGEATHPFDFTTAHGAHDSGRRAAEEAIAALDRTDRTVRKATA